MVAERQRYTFEAPDVACNIRGIMHFQFTFIAVMTGGGGHVHKFFYHIEYRHIIVSLSSNIILKKSK